MATPEPTIDIDIEDRLHLGQADDGRAISEVEFAEAYYDEPWRYELVEGRLVVMSPEGTGHVQQSMPWLYRLGAYCLDHPHIVQAVVSQAWVRIDAKNARIGDIGVFLGGDLADLDIPRQVPDLMFEFVSPSAKDRRRDYVEKRAQYERIGIKEYVIVDRSDGKVTVLTLVGGVYEERALGAADTYETPRLPGFAVRLAEVLPR